MCVFLLLLFCFTAFWGVNFVPQLSQGGSRAGQHVLLQELLCRGHPPAESQPRVCCARCAVCWHHVACEAVPALS